MPERNGYGQFCPVSMAAEVFCSRWTPHSAACMLRWVIKGLCSEWLLFGRRFDLASEGREGLRRLIGSLQAAK